MSAVHMLLIIIQQYYVRKFQVHLLILLCVYALCVYVC